MNTKDFISIRDFSPSEIQELLRLGRQIKAHPDVYSESPQRENPGHDLREALFDERG